MEYDVSGFGGNAIGEPIKSYIRFNEAEEAVRIDEVNDELTYIGYSKVYGPDESLPVWKIKKVYKTGSVWNIKYAITSNDNYYSNIWNDRSTLNYI